MVGYRAKWVEDSFEFANTPRRFEFAASDAKLLAQLEGLARTHVSGNGIVGLRASDFRVDAEGPWILEVNTNPCISPDAGFAAALEHSVSATATPSPGSSTPPSPIVEGMTIAPSVPALAHGGNRNKDAPLLLLRLE